MTHEDEAMLERFRAVKRCEFCLAKLRRAEPHHIRHRGMDGGARLDIAINLISLDLVCHRKAHDGNIPKEKLLAIVADREGVTVDWINDRVNVILRTPKHWGWTVADILGGATPEGPKEATGEFPQLE